MATYHVKVTGNDANPGSDAQPWLTVAHAVTVMVGGDTLYIHVGTYVMQLRWPAGGSSGAPTIISAFPGDTVVLQPTSGDGITGSWSSANNWVKFSGLILDGSSSGDSAGGFHFDPDHVTLEDCEIRNWSGGGSHCNGSFNTMRRCSVHDNGASVLIGPGHGIYISGHDNLVEYSDLYDNDHYAVHVYNSGANDVSRNIIRFNTIHGNGKSAVGLTPGGFGILLSSGADNQAYRNVLWDNGDTGLTSGGIQVFNSLRARVLNNTIYGNFIGVDISGSAVATEFRNNILRSNTSEFSDLGSLTVNDHNHFHADDDPLFTNAGSADFTLQAGSPCINQGAILDGISYADTAPDQGALEFGGEDLPALVVTVTPNPIPPGGSGTVTWESDGDSVDIPGVGEGLPASGSATLSSGQSLVSVQAYNNNGSTLAQQSVAEFAAGITYHAGVGYMPRSIKQGADLSVDNMEIVGLMPDKVKVQALGLVLMGLNNEDLDVGRLDHARTVVFVVNHQDLSQGPIILPASGNIGQIKLRRTSYEAEMRGLTLYLQQTFGDLYSRLCRARVGDDIGDGTGEHDYKKPGFGCKVRLDPPFWRSAHAYTVRPAGDAAKGSVVKPSVYNGRHYQCTVAGTSGLTEPTWPTLLDDTVVDGTVTWKAIRALTAFGSVTTAIDRRFFQDSARNEPPTSGLGVNTGTAQYAIRDANLAGNFFAIEGGDLTSIFTTGRTFAVTDSPGNDGTYTVANSTLDGSRTQITVVETIPDTQAGGFVGAPVALATGFWTFGKLTFLTGANRGIAKEVKEFSLASYAIVDVDQGSKLFMLDGDVSAFFSVDQRFPVKDSTGNDGDYDVVSVAYNAGNDQTEVEVAQAIPDATIDGVILSGPGQFELFERMPFEIAEDDEYMASAGCDQSPGMCKSRKFDNIKNFRGEPEIPGTDVSMQFPDSQI